jgi:hypothetical protein
LGQELNKLRVRREARQRFEGLNKKRNLLLILHYSCESFYDIRDGRTPRITSIAARDFAAGQTSSFSIHKSAEQRGVVPADIAGNYDALERSMLSEYFDFINTRHGYTFVHWNMRDINYGFQAIEHRYKVLGSTPFVIDDNRKFDLARELIALYGVRYVSHGAHGRLHSLMELNRISSKDVLTGAEEAEAFDNKQFVRLHQSTLRKVDVMANILERTFLGSLKTDAKWRDIHSIHPSALVELVRDHWVTSLVVGVLALAGFIAALQQLLG